MGKDTQSIDSKQVNGKKTLKIDEIEGYLLGNYEIRINIITNTIEKRTKDTKEPFEPINENDLKYELLKKGHSRFDGELKAILGSSAIPKFDPLKEYFEGLPKWDTSQPDYIQELSTYVKTDDQKWFEMMFKKMLVRVVAQALNKIHFNKHCFTFVGNQHDGKTSFFEFLIPNKLNSYARKGYDFHGGREGKIALSQNFMINLDELAQFDKKDLNNEFKATLSEGYVKLRPLYSNNEVSIPRRASFVASTNHFDFLTDSTGSVRWIIFNVLNINHDNGQENGYSKKVDIDKVWAQAYTLLNEGFKCELNRDEISQNEILNRRFLRITTEMELIAIHFQKAQKGQSGADFYTPAKIEKTLREMGYPKLLNTQIGAALKMLGFPQTSNWNSALRYSEKGYFLTKN